MKAKYIEDMEQITNDNSPGPLIKTISLSGLNTCDHADSFLQSSLWGRFKSRFGWEAMAFSVEWAQGGLKPLLALVRRIAPGFSMAYIPWGPELPAGFPDDSRLQVKAAEEAAVRLRALLPSTVAFIRFDIPHSSFLISHSPPSPFKKAAADIQAPDTVIVDLTPPPETILAAMKPKWRYNIKLAEKHEVTVHRHTQLPDPQSPLLAFYQLLVETATRDGIAIHNLAYYQALFEECQQEESAVMPVRLYLYTAGHEGDVLAAIVALFRGTQATYLYGASANFKRNLMAPYALQWKAMLDAKEFGCTQYDLFGIPPDENPHHPMHGLYRFKTGFGGHILHRGGSWDYPCKPLWYAVFCAAERLRKKIRDMQKK